MPKRLAPGELLQPPAADHGYVGVVLDIPEPFQAQLHRMRVAAGDPLAHVSKPHITLVPPTELSAQEMAGVEEHLSGAAAAHRQFDVELSGVESFRPISPVVFARVTTGWQECEALESTIRQGPLAVEVLFDYHPHVTLAHNLPEAELDHTMQTHQDLQMRFPISSFEHYQWSGDGWQLQQRYDLASRC